MTKTIKISIPTPCHEGWENMAPADKGRFCSSCQKTVIDFTRLSDREITNAFKNDKNLCGKFLNSQLQRDLIIPKEKNSLWVSASAAVISFLTIGNNTATAQAPVHTEQTENKTDDIKSETTTIVTITGTVTDEDGLAIPGTNITIKGSKIGVQTDIDGNYSIEVLPNDILEFSFIGLQTVDITVKNSAIINIAMKDDQLAVSNGVVVTIESKEHSFFGRVFHSIGNWFR